MLFRSSGNITTVTFCGNVFSQSFYVLGQSARGIWVHGVFEIFSMVIETMAGLVLGASILFPKTFSRLNSLFISFPLCESLSFSLFLFVKLIFFSVSSVISVLKNLSAQGKVLRGILLKSGFSGGFFFISAKQVLIATSNCGSLP